MLRYFSESLMGSSLSHDALLLVCVCKRHCGVPLSGLWSATAVSVIMVRNKPRSIVIRVTGLSSMPRVIMEGLAPRLLGGHVVTLVARNEHL